MRYNLSISGKHYDYIKAHLFPGDGKEAIVVCLCGSLQLNDITKLLVHKVMPIPYDKCFHRSVGLIKWPTGLIFPLLTEAGQKELNILTIHSHPEGCKFFSETDNKGDIELCDSFYGWTDGKGIHGSAVMLSNDDMIARIWTKEGDFIPIDYITIAGDDIKFIFNDEQENGKDDSFSLRTKQTFGEGTTNILSKLRIGIVGASGTGAPTIEQLTRLGVGSLLLIDPDKVEEKNLNRITNSTMEDARNSKSKVKVLKKAIENIGLGTKVIAHEKNLYDSIDVIKCLASCDIIFGCVDSIDGRHLMNQISTFYLVPYIDTGIHLNSDGKGGIEVIYFVVQYLQPGGASFLSRRFFSNEELRSAGMLRTAPEEYKRLKKIGYIADIPMENPAIISIDTQAATFAVNEFLARIHPFRYDANKYYAITRVNITGGYIQHEEDGEPDKYLSRLAGRGDMEPFLNMPELC
jgi:hypothetical protein